MDIKKRGKNFIINSIFVVVVIMSLVVFLKTQGHGITGYQVMDPVTAKLKLETALSSSSFAQTVTQGSICIAINDPEMPMSFEAVKSGTSWTVTQEDDLFCKGSNNEDVVILFKNHGDFSRVFDDPSPRNIANAAMLRTFEILPSRYVQPGGDVVCDATFKVKFCDALNQVADVDQLIDGDMVCCADKLSRAQKKQLEEHLASGGYTDEIGVLEQAGSGFSMLSLFILIVIVVAIGGGAAGFFLFGKKKGKGADVGNGAVPGTPTGPGTPRANMSTQEPTDMRTRPVHAGVQAAGLAQPDEMGHNIYAEQDQQVEQLKEYALQTLQQGYTPQELLQHFIEQGWDQTTATNAINEAVARINQGY